MPAARDNAGRGKFHGADGSAHMAASGGFVQASSMEIIIRRHLMHTELSFLLHGFSICTSILFSPSLIFQVTRRKTATGRLHPGGTQREFSHTEARLHARTEAAGTPATEAAGNGPASAMTTDVRRRSLLATRYINNQPKHPSLLTTCIIILLTFPLFSSLVSVRSDDRERAPGKGEEQEEMRPWRQHRQDRDGDDVSTAMASTAGGSAAAMQVTVQEDRREDAAAAAAAPVQARRRRRQHIRCRCASSQASS